MIHCIYQELVVAVGSSQDEIRKLQIIPRIACIHLMPVEVMDVVYAAEADISLAKINVHFTGNADGGIQQVEFGGVNGIVMAGPNIIE